MALEPVQQHDPKPPAALWLFLPALAAVALPVCLAFVLGFAAFYARAMIAPAAGNPEGVFWEAWDLVEQEFYSEIPPVRARVYGAIVGMLETAGDPYTVFVAPQPRQLERDNLRGQYGGIGVDLWRDGEGRLRMSPYPDAPAARAGVEQDDVLIAVDGVPVALTDTMDSVQLRLRGDVGTSVQLTLAHPPALSQTLDLVVVREQIRIPSVLWRQLDPPDVGYVRLTGFTELTAQELKDALVALQTAGSTRLVLDLRGNSGGLLEPAVQVASQFLRDGVVLYELRREEERPFPVQPGGTALDMPVVVLVDSTTASAAEIVAAALQDTGRAVILGETTYGKGSVQLIFELSDGSALHVTAYQWLTPARRRLDGQGLVPDVVLGAGNGVRDVQLSAAVELLRSQP